MDRTHVRYDAYQQRVGLLQSSQYAIICRYHYILYMLRINCKRLWQSGAPQVLEQLPYCDSLRLIPISMIRIKNIWIWRILLFRGYSIFQIVVVVMDSMLFIQYTIRCLDSNVKRSSKQVRLLGRIFFTPRYDSVTRTRTCDFSRKVNFHARMNG